MSFRLVMILVSSVRSLIQIYIRALNNPFTVDSVTAILRLVINGAGIHLGTRWLFDEAIQKGQVIPLLSMYLVQSFPVQCVYTSHAYLPIKVREFAWLLKEYLVVVL